MEISVKEKNDIKIIKLNGDLDNTSSEQTRDVIMEEIEDNCRIIIDMENCQYVSSAGLRVLMIFAKKIKTVQGQGVLANIVSEVEEVMEMTGFGHMLKSYSTLDEAVDFLEREGENQ
ncbi:MAG: STAS domain-containing protein [Bacillota bacterium]